jgi:hypothetical protein
VLAVVARPYQRRWFGGLGRILGVLSWLLAPGFCVILEAMQYQWFTVTAQGISSQRGASDAANNPR